MKLWRLATGPLTLLRIGGAYMRQCCCWPPPCDLYCLWAVITLDGYPYEETIELQLDLDDATPCTGESEPTQVRCHYSGSSLCLGEHTVTLARTCANDWILTVDGTPSDAKNAPYPYGAFTFPVGSGLAATLYERDRAACSPSTPYACVAYQATGETADFVRLCVPACSLPADWADGWTEEGYDIPDYFTCRVLNFLSSCSYCTWDTGGTWQPYQTLCVRETKTIDDIPIVTEYTLTPCPPWPTGGPVPCYLYGHPAKWHGGGGDDHVLFVNWDGSWTYDFIGGGCTGTNPTGPYGTYTWSGLTAEVYACPT